MGYDMIIQFIGVVTAKISLRYHVDVLVNFIFMISDVKMNALMICSKCHRLCGTPCPKFDKFRIFTFSSRPGSFSFTSVSLSDHVTLTHACDFATANPNTLTFNARTSCNIEHDHWPNTAYPDWFLVANAKQLALDAVVWLSCVCYQYFAKGRVAQIWFSRICHVISVSDPKLILLPWPWSEP